MLEDLENRDDIGVHQLGGGACLIQKSSIEPGSIEMFLERPLQGNLTLKLEIPGAVDNSHAAAPKFFDNFEVTDTQRQLLRMKT